MKQNELSELFNFSERKKYDIVQRGIPFALTSDSVPDLDEVIHLGVIVLVTEDKNADEFPAIDVAVITGYRVEDGERKLIVRKLSDLSVSYTVTHVVPIGDAYRPVVLSTDGHAPLRTCTVVGYRITTNRLSVEVIGNEDAGIVALPLEGIQAIKMEA